MPEVLGFIAVLLGVITAIANAANRRKEKAAAAPAAGRPHQVMKIRPAPAAYRLERAAAARVQPQPMTEAGKAARAAATPTAGAGRIIPAPALKPGRDGAKGIQDSLGRIFSEEEQLLAAFIFHEVLGLPRSLRR